MATKQKVAPVVTKVAKEPKAKKEWTKESALQFIKSAKTVKGLKYWGAVDYLKKVHGLEVEQTGKQSIIGIAPDCKSGRNCVAGSSPALPTI